MNSQPVLIALLLAFVLGAAAGAVTVYGWASWRTRWVHERRWVTQ